ncbi:response regulator [Paenibacillus amylolyticus]|nr:response regulator [Paenibacillus amylolyticus]
MELTVEPLKVLIVDDEYLIRNLLRMRIDWKQQGMTIIGEASDAEEALNQVELLRPDIVFTDIYMPKMDGIELSGILMERYPNIKIVVVTGHDEFEYARQSVKLGISDFILKPIRASELLQVTAKLRVAIEQEIGREYELMKLRGGNEAELALSQGAICESMVK